MDGEIVVLSKIVKNFGATRALDGVDFTLKRGEIHSIVGENGAGKSTLVNILYGLTANDSGEITVKGVRYKSMSPATAKKIGIAFIPQKLQLIPELTVGENIFLNSWPRKRALRLIDWAEIKRRSEEFLRNLELSIDPTIKVGSLSYVDQQIITITKSFFHDRADIIVLDEPTAPLASHEIELLFNFIRSLRKEGTSFIYISHYLDEVLEISDRVTVLRDGKVVYTSATGSLNTQELTVKMVGENIDLYKDREAKYGEKILEVKNLTKPPLLRDVDFSLYRGEILGLAGLKGSGRTELARVICGLDRFDEGEIRFQGAKASFKSVKKALERGVGYLSEDRIRWGVFAERPIKENVTVSFLKKIVNRIGMIKSRMENEVVESYVDMLKIKLTDINQSLNQLSGGNQQKVMIAKLLGCDLEVFIFDDPTFGIDIKAKMHVHKTMADLVENGKSILLISSDMNELTGMCDRIIVLEDSRIADERRKEEFDKITLFDKNRVVP